MEEGGRRRGWGVLGREERDAGRRSQEGDGEEGRRGRDG
jgi:hypothetical protein